MQFLWQYWLKKSQKKEERKNKEQKCGGWFWLLPLPAEFSIHMKDFVSHSLRP